MATRPMGWAWRARRDGPLPQAVVAWGEAVLRLQDRVARMPAPVQQRLQATGSRDVLVLIGGADDLPWVRGVAYAAPSAEAPALWLPTLWEPDVPTDLLGRALRARHDRSPLLLWAEPEAVVPLDRQLPLPAMVCVT